MPTQVLPDEMSFRAFERALLKRGFRRITRPEFVADFGRLDLRAPSPRTGSEAGFVFTAKGLTVVVWTSYVEALGRARDSDLGWVLIREKDERKYVSPPLRRTENFLYHLLERAAIARERVLHRPLCPLCKRFMRITIGKGLWSRYWTCGKHSSGEVVNLPWDYDLPEVVLERVKSIRKKREPYKKRLQKEGKKPGAAMRRRIGWKVGKPENKLP